MRIYKYANKEALIPGLFHNRCHLPIRSGSPDSVTSPRGQTVPRTRRGQSHGATPHHLFPLTENEGLCFLGSASYKYQENIREAGKSFRTWKCVSRIRCRLTSRGQCAQALSPGVQGSNKKYKEPLQPLTNGSLSPEGKGKCLPHGLRARVGVGHTGAPGLTKACSLY